MKTRQTGFTLIELVMVIVILGVLAAAAIPKFISLAADANTAAVQSVAGSLAAASATNYAARSVKSSYGVPIANCTDAPTTLASLALPTGAGGTYAVAALAVGPCVTSACTLTFTPTSGTAVTATFSLTGIA